MAQRAGTATDYYTVSHQPAGAIEPDVHNHTQDNTRETTRDETEILPQKRETGDGIHTRQSQSQRRSHLDMLHGQTGQVSTAGEHSR